jgi:zinc transport system substrate-binding protein
LKKILLLSALMALVLAACAGPVPQDDPEKLTISVSILPQQWFVDQIGGDRVRTQAMVGSGDDPHTYEPTPQQMTNLADSDLFFTIGVEFEAVWLPRFESANPEMKVVDAAAGIELIPALDAHNHTDGEVEDQALTGSEADPHIWFSPLRMKQMAQTMAEAMKTADPRNADFYQSNLETLLNQIDSVDSEVKKQLEGSKRDHFMVVHPAWGYVAEDYGLHMLAVEIGGSEPAPESLSQIIALAKEYEINTLVIEKGSNIRLATSIAEQAGIQSIVEWDPMAYDWPASMLMIAETLHQALN